MLRHGSWFEKVVSLVMILLLGLMSVIIPEFDSMCLCGSTTLYQGARRKLLASMKRKRLFLYNSAGRLDRCGKAADVPRVSGIPCPSPPKAPVQPEDKRNSNTEDELFNDKHDMTLW